MARPRGYRLSAHAWEDVTKLRGLSLSEVADRAGIGRATVSGLLGGHARASLPMAHRLASTLDVHPETLFPTMRRDMLEVDAAA